FRSRDSSQDPLTRSQRGRSIPCSTWQVFVVTELAPAHQRTEKSHGAFTTYRLTEMLSWRYSLGKESGFVRQGRSALTENCRCFTGMPPGRPTASLQGCCHTSQPRALGSWGWRNPLRTSEAPGGWLRTWRPRSFM
uniref:Uncharacterized protein n=1 Tax=Varanus komodoensis TaxID=61221 RepID=A0A8D2L1S8_VARKO